MSRPLISVITATVDRREQLLLKLAALEAQSLPAERFEWIVCVNGGDEAVAAELERRTPSFDMRVVRLSENRGAGAGRNAAAALALGDVLYLSDDDCLPAPDTLERHLAAQSTPCIAVGAIRFLPPVGRQRSWRPGRVGYWNVNGANTSVPAAAFRRVGGFDAELRDYGGEDVLLGYQLSRLGLPLRALPRAEVSHLGADPASGAEPAKLRSAGRNAARIARRYPELRFRLGVHPLLLRLKLALLPLIESVARDRMAGDRIAGEIAYALGAREVVRPYEGEKQ